MQVKDAAMLEKDWLKTCDLMIKKILEDIPRLESYRTYKRVRALWEVMMNAD